MEEIKNEKSYFLIENNNNNIKQKKRKNIKFNSEIR
jgi:hypothetical protein